MKHFLSQVSSKDDYILSLPEAKRDLRVLEGAVNLAIKDGSLSFLLGANDISWNPFILEYFKGKLYEQKGWSLKTEAGEESTKFTLE